MRYCRPWNNNECSNIGIKYIIKYNVIYELFKETVRNKNENFRNVKPT